MMFRINQLLLLVLIGVSVLQSMFWLALPLGLVFTFYYGAIWLVFLAICIDAYFGAFAGIPAFSFGLLAWYVVSELLKLRLRTN